MIVIDDFIEQNKYAFKRGWIFMGDDNRWWYTVKKPTLKTSSYYGSYWNFDGAYICLSDFFKIQSASDWTKTLRKVG